MITTATTALTSGPSSVATLALDAQIWWYSARAAGIIAWALAAAGILWGIWLSGARRRVGPRPSWVLDMHRFLGGLSLVMTAAHLAGLAADSYFHFSWAELFVPGRSPYRTGAVTLGIGALAGMVVVESTSVALRHLPRRVWHVTHLASYLVFVLATVHGWRAGTETAGQPIMRLTYLGVAACVAVLTIVRVNDRLRARPRTPSSAVSTATSAMAATSAPAGAPAPPAAAVETVVSAEPAPVSRP
jgi:DMSO/TMAO reductase YedYZ heme-binding membrane subunit